MCTNDVSRHSMMKRPNAGASASRLHSERRQPMAVRWMIMFFVLDTLLDWRAAPVKNTGAWLSKQTAMSHANTQSDCDDCGRRHKIFLAVAA